jgi:flagellar biosynthesis protein FlhF
MEFSTEVLGLYNQLRERDVQDELCKEIATQTQSIRSRRDVDAKAVVHQLVCDRLGEAMPLKLKKFERNVLLFLGPTGAGKTTTLAKLAGTLKFKEHLDVGMINTDTYRVGAMEHIRLYAEIMDIPLAMAYNAGELEEALQQMADKDVVLIDTAGKNARDEVNRQELKQLVEAAKADEVFLVMSVVTGAKTCRDVIQQFSFLDDYKLIITKLDEADVWGNVLNIADYSKKGLTYVTVGQNVPDDIREANTQWLARSILGDGVICYD